MDRLIYAIALMPAGIAVLFVIAALIDRFLVWSANRKPVKPKRCPECGCTRVRVYCARCGWADKSHAEYHPPLRPWKAGDRIAASPLPFTTRWEVPEQTPASKSTA